MSLPIMNDEQDWSGYISILNGAGLLAVFHVITQNTFEFDVFLSYILGLIYFFGGLLSGTTSSIIKISMKNQVIICNKNEVSLLNKLSNSLYSKMDKNVIYFISDDLTQIFRVAGLFLFGLGSLQIYGTLIYSQECVYEHELPIFFDNFLFNFPVKYMPQAPISGC